MGDMVMKIEAGESRRLHTPTEPSPSIRRKAPRPRRQALPSSADDGDVARALGREAWLRLPPSVRRRFTKPRGDGVQHRYRGVMARVDCSRLGWIVAQAARLIGTPLSPFAGRDVPVTVTVSAEPDGGGERWDRSYAFPGRTPITVTSFKRMDADGTFVECVGGGFGMTLRLSEQGGTLHFVSQRYFWQVGRLRLPWPALLSPGTAHVVHTDQGRGLFRFTITITHRLFGRLFHQDGLFSEEGEDPWKSYLPC